MNQAPRICFALLPFNCNARSQADSDSDDDSLDDVTCTARQLYGVEEAKEGASPPMKNTPQPPESESGNFDHS